MSFADSINGFKKAYTTEYKDNNSCPFDETVGNSENKADLIKFAYTKEASADSYETAYAAMATSYDVEEDYENEEGYEVPASYGNKTEEYHAEEAPAEDDAEQFGFDA